MIRLSHVLLLGIILCTVATANTCTGIVRCQETGRVLKDVEVKSPGTDMRVLTDVSGRFTFGIGRQPVLTLVFDKAGFMTAEQIVTAKTPPLEIKLRPLKLSAASFRWLDYIESDSAYNTLIFNEDPQWSPVFKQSDLRGDFVSDPQYVRRDPSAVIKVDNLYYTYYTRGTRYAPAGTTPKLFPWDQCDIWYATSKDGWDWQEQGPAVVRGSVGFYDDASVFTVEVLPHEGKYYLVYQCVQNPYVKRVKNTVGMAVADSPRGPFKKLSEPILRPTDNGIWKAGSESRFDIIKKGSFDSHKVHDPCLMFYKGKFYLYYKGERMGEENFFSQREIRWGVAIADNPTGPYIKSEYNPITTSGHEVCVWHYQGGIALIHTDDGPERHTVQWSADGINFELMGRVGVTPKAFGLYRCDNPDSEPLEGVRWGLCHSYGGGDWRTSWNFIKRFDLVDTE